MRGAIAIWIVGIVAGFALLQVHAARPGDAAAAPAFEPPAHRAQVEAAPAPTAPAPTTSADPPSAPATGTARLHVFIHPHCVCTRASLDAVAGLVERAVAPLDVIVHVVDRSRPNATTPTDGHNVERARGIPRVTIRPDDGRAAGTFGAMTSGHVVFYDADGRGRFSGGLTPARAHPGDTIGARIIRDVLASADPVPAVDPIDVPVPTGPVFGCPLAATTEVRR